MFARPFVSSLLVVTLGLCSDCKATSDDLAFGAATLAIAADTVYDLRLNGREIHSGRFPDVPPQRYFDTLPVTELLSR